MMNTIEIGRMLRANTSRFVAGCRVNQLETPLFGALVRVSLDSTLQVYGLIYDIHIEDDGLVRQLVTSEQVDESIIADNRVNRNVPVEISILVVGHRQGDQIYHLLPPRPPLSLDVIYLCDPAEMRLFTSGERLGYFRHVLRAGDLSIGELLTAHLAQLQPIHTAAGNPGWTKRVIQELITLLRDNHATLMEVLDSIAELDRSAWS